MPEAIWHRCYVHFLRNALDYLPRKANDDCLMELRWLYDRRNVEGARRGLAAWLAKRAPRYPKLCAWVEDNIEETLSFYRLPRQHHKNLKSTNMLERIMEEIKRRTLVVRIFPNSAGPSQARTFSVCSLRSFPTLVSRRRYQPTASPWRAFSRQPEGTRTSQRIYKLREAVVNGIRVDAADLRTKSKNLRRNAAPACA